MKRLHDVLKDCKKEEEVKTEFCKFFKTKLNALKAIDHYTEGVFFEFKYDRNFKNLRTVAASIAQTMYYARMLKFSLTRCPLPPHICIVGKNQAFFIVTKTYAKFYASTSQKYDWDRAASTPCPNLVADIETFPALKSIYVYDLTNPAQDDEFVKKCERYLNVQALFFDLLDKKSITEENFFEVFEYWDSLFGNYVRNGRKSSEYFLADIESGKSLKGGEIGEVLFDVDGANFVRKTLKPKEYEHFWQNYEKADPRMMLRIRQKADRITDDFRRRFTGEFYTPVEFAAKGLEYVGKELKSRGKEWWESGEYRFWDMAAGTGNLEFNLPSAALRYCYISTLEEDEAKYCAKIFPGATCFQYNYLEDDVAHLAGDMVYGMPRKMPPNLVADLANPKIKWIVFINPPFATANTAGGETGKTSKDTVSRTTVRAWMKREGYGEASRELFTQFLFRISKEFAGKDAHLGMFSKLKYVNSNNDQKIRDGFFQYAYRRGFIFPIQCFHGSKGNFPVGFLVWDLRARKHLKGQKISLDVFNGNIEKVGTKVMPSVERTAMLNKWCPRPRWDGHSVMPMFSSALKQQTENEDKRDHIADGYLFSVCSKGDDFQNQNSVFILSAPYANAGAFSVTPENFERAMVLHAVKKLPKATWTNDRDAFYAPSAELPKDFVTDCVVWNAFAASNYTVSLKDVKYHNRLYRIRNNLYPFALNQVKSWKCANAGLAAQIAAANDDGFLAGWLKGRALSPEAKAVMDAGRTLYRKFYAELVNTNWIDYKIETWDVGYYQICQALKGTGIADKEVSALKSAHDALRAKLLPKVYEYGFLNPDVMLYTEEA